MLSARAFHFWLIAGFSLFASLAAHAAVPVSVNEYFSKLTPAEDAYEDFSESRIYQVSGNIGDALADEDVDLVPNFEDLCPDTPKGEPVDECGCPIDFCAIDSDKDGVADCNDKCRRTPPGIKVDKDGCPLPILKKTRIRLNVNFEFAQANILDAYVADLDRLRALLVRFPNLVVTLEGHTDSKGSHSYNDSLSLARARICRSYILEDSRIHPDRIRAAGYGKRQPIASNKTDEGRALNRRTVAELDIAFGLPVDSTGKAEEIAEGVILENIMDPAGTPEAYVKPEPPKARPSVTKSTDAPKPNQRKVKSAQEVYEELRKYQEQLEAQMTPEQREAAQKMRKAIEDAQKKAAERRK